MSGFEKAKLGLALGELAVDALVALDVISKDEATPAEAIVAGVRAVIESVTGAAEGKLTADEVRDSMAERVARAKRLIPDARAEIRRRKARKE